MPGILSEGAVSGSEPQVWRTAVMPMWAPRCFGSAAMVSMRLRARP